MEIKQGAENVTITIKPRFNGAVITMAAWAALYGEADFNNGVYTLLSETGDKTGNESIVASSVSATGMTFTLPDTMFETAQRVWTNILKFLLNGKTDFALYNFDIKVTKPQSVNAR